jgi:hypothetical protein
MLLEGDSLPLNGDGYLSANEQWEGETVHRGSLIMISACADFGGTTESGAAGRWLRGPPRRSL